MTRRYTDALTGQDMILNNFGGFKLAVKTFDGAQIVDRQNCDTSSFPRGEGIRAKTLQIPNPKIGVYNYLSPTRPDPSADPKDCPLERRQSCLGLLCAGITGLFVPTAFNVTEDATERAAAMIEWQDVEVHIFDHLLVTSSMVSIGLVTNTLAVAWMAGGDA